MRIIIFPPTIDWSWMRQRHQQLAIQFSLHGHEVYYCNRSQRKDTNLLLTQQNLTIVHNHDFFVKQVLPSIKKTGKEILVWSFWPTHVDTLNIYKPDYVVFDYIDDFPQWDRYLPKMVSNSDLLIASSISLKNKVLEEFPERECFLIPNGCTPEIFNKNLVTNKPKELHGHRGPIITYIGALAPWIDQELIKELAGRMPGALILMIGASLKTKLIDMPPNVKYIGHRPYSLLPNYLYFSYVCLIPFKINSITQATNPVKLYEYLAAGKPVISTDLPEVKSAPYVFIGEDADSFIQQINYVLSPTFNINKTLLNEWLSEHTWTKRYQDLEKILLSRNRKIQISPSFLYTIDVKQETPYN